MIRRAGSKGLTAPLCGPGISPWTLLLARSRGYTYNLVFVEHSPLIEFGETCKKMLLLL